MADSSYESVSCVKNEVFVYKIPPRPSNRGYRASEWKLDAPDWTGRLRVVALGKELFIKLEDKTTGELFAQCPVDAHPGIAVEAVMDSSRYFVLRIKDPSGRSAFIGIGFADRSDSFDLNVSLQDHFKWMKQEEEAQKTTEELTAGPKLDLGFKDGQTIKLNIGKLKDGGARTKPKPRATGGILPPPPGGPALKIPPPSAGGSRPAPPLGSSPGLGSAAPSAPSAPDTSNLDFLLDLGPEEKSGSAPLAPAAQPSTLTSSDGWGDFTGASNSAEQPAPDSNGGGWVQF